VSARFYDVVVLGTDLAPLTCGALLAKRGFRVLVVAQHEPEPNYPVGPFDLPRRPLRCVFGQTPAQTRVFAELGLGQALRRLSTPLEPAFQVAMPDHRFDVSRDEARLARELGREFPGVRRPIEDFHKRVGRVMQGLDEVLAHDLVLPPETFFERQAFLRARRFLELPRSERHEDVLSEFPDEHPFRSLATLPARFDGGIDPAHAELAPLQLLRLYGNQRRGALAIEGGLHALREVLIQKIQSHSGHVKLDEHAAELIVARGQVSGLRLSRGGEEISCGFVVAGVDLSALQRILPDRSAFEELFERIGEPQVRQYRYTLNVVLRKRGLPSGLGSSLYLVSGKEQDGHATPLHVHAQRLDTEHALLCTEALLSARRVEDDSSYVPGTRGRIMASLRQLLPFLDEHLVLIDSPHDNRMPEGAITKLDNANLARRGPATMRAVYSYPVVGALGLCALPLRTPIKHLLFCNAQVVPGLGSEGLLLAACGAARLVTWADRSRSWMRRRLWTKVEM
jgi:phytoene dehydrogenase-like protein